jgi:hypothetical protein
VALATFVLLPLSPVVGGQAKALPEPPPSGVSDVLDWQATSCPGPTSQVPTGGQFLDGRVDLCVQVPDVPGGTYHLAWTSYLTRLTGRTTPTTLPTPSAGASPAISLAASPVSVLPGGALTLTGRLKRPQKLNRDPFVDLCWDGCPGGLAYDVPAHWLSPTSFSARITAPDAPWAETGPDRVVSPVAGNYEVGVRCVELMKSCGLGPAEGEVAVRLRASAHYTCQALPGCAQLRVSPQVASPGEVVKVTGYAPIASTTTGFEGEALIGGDLVGGRGGHPGPAVSFSSQGPAFGASTVDVRSGDASVLVEPAPTWASLGHLTPIGQVPGAELPISANPLAPSTVAWCAGSYVGLEGQAGTTDVPTSGATALLLADKSLPSADKGQIQDCSTVAVQGGALFVGYAYSPEMMAPEVDNVALYSTDWGRTWSFVPVPQGALSSAFAGFRYGAGGVVDALFARGAQGAGPAVAAPAVEQYSTATGQWSAVPFACPPTGPCVTWGLATVPDCGMTQSFAQAVVSLDGGHAWALPPRELGAVETCFSASLVALSPSEALVVGVDGAVNASGLYPLVMTEDYGQSWQLLSLPLLPGKVASDQSLLMLQDGAIVDVSAQPWDLLRPGASAWCAAGAMPAQPAGTFAISTSFTVIGPSLWWLASRPSSAAPVLADHVADSSLTCRA